MSDEKGFYMKNIVELSEFDIGEILATDVVDKGGGLCAVEDTEINGYIKNKLTEMGDININIYDSFGNIKLDNPTCNKFMNDNKNAIIQIKKIITELAVGKSVKFEKINNLPDIIDKNIQENSDIMGCLQEIRNIDEYTYSHSINTAFYSMLIGKWLNLSDEELKKVIESGLLHDVGKTKIPVDILNKNGIITKDEYNLIKKHTILGYDMLRDMKDIDPDIKQAVLLHHERIDRSGYPFKADPQNVNLYAKIIAVADVYDAMSSDRVYKKRSTPFETFNMFLTVGRDIFDENVVNTFLKHISVYFIGSNVELSNGDIGKIVDVPPLDIIHPIISVNSGYINLACKNQIQIVSVI